MPEMRVGRRQWPDVARIVLLARKLISSRMRRGIELREAWRRASWLIENGIALPP